MATSAARTPAPTAPAGTRLSLRWLRIARSHRLESTDPRLWWDRADPELWYDSSDAADIADPIDPAEANEPTLANEANDAALPTESTESWEQIERTEFSDQSDHILSSVNPSQGQSPMHSHGPEPAINAGVWTSLIKRPRMRQPRSARCRAGVRMTACCLRRGRYRFPRPNIRPKRPAIELAGLISTRVDPSGSGRFAACSAESVVETYVV